LSRPAETGAATVTQSQVGGLKQDDGSNA